MVDNGTTYTQTWDIENRLTVVTATKGLALTVTRFYYDGDGQRVKTVGPGTTVWVQDAEPNGPTASGTWTWVSSPA